jgi:hypothetical protein
MELESEESKTALIFNFIRVDNLEAMRDDLTKSGLA